MYYFIIIIVRISPEATSAPHSRRHFALPNHAARDGNSMGSAMRARYAYEGKKFPSRFFKENENIPPRGELAVKLFHELKLDKEHVDLFTRHLKKLIKTIRTRSRFRRVLSL